MLHKITQVRLSCLLKNRIETCVDWNDGYVIISQEVNSSQMYPLTCIQESLSASCTHCSVYVYIPLVLVSAFSVSMPTLSLPIQMLNKRGGQCWIFSFYDICSIVEQKLPTYHLCHLWLTLTDSDTLSSSYYTHWPGSWGWVAKTS